MNMITEENIKKMVKKLQTQLGINENVHVMLIPLKSKAASISLRKKILRLNKRLIEKIDEETLQYLVLHELIHIKLNTIHHTKEFYNVLYKLMNEGEKDEYDLKILKEMMKIIRTIK